MSDQTHPGGQPNLADTIAEAQNVSWERNQSLLAKNQFAFTGPATPVQFKFNNNNNNNNAPTTSPPPATQPNVSINLNSPPPQPAAPVITTVTPVQHPPAAQPVGVAAAPAIVLPTSPAPPAAAQLAPVPVGNFGKWAAYYNPNPTVNRPYFYCHSQSITTYDCPQEIQPEFAPQYAVFLQNYRASNPQPSKPIPPPGFTTLSRNNSSAQPHNATSAGPQPTPTVPPAGVAGGPPPHPNIPLPTKPPFSLPNTPSSSSTRPPALPSPIQNSGSHSRTNSVVGLNLDPDGPALSSNSQGTVADLTPHHANQNSFSFNSNERVANPSNLPQLRPKGPPAPPSRLQHSQSHNTTSTAPLIDDMPEQHPLATIIAARPSQSIGSRISLPPFKAGLLAIPNDNAPTINPPSGPTTPANSTPSHISSLASPSHASSLGLPTNRSFGAPQPVPDQTTPFSELVKVDALPTQKDGTFLKLTTGFRKSWKPRYIILHQGAFRWWDDTESAKKQMTSPNAVVSIVGCVAQLPPIGSHIHPKNGLYIDGNVGSIKEILDKYEQTQDYEISQFFIRTDNLGEVDSWMHILYRNGIIDGRYVLNPDLTKTNDQVVAQTHKCFEVWSRERVASNTVSTPIPETNGSDADLRTSTAQLYINPAELASPTAASLTLRPGMYVPSGIYQYQPTPTPVHINGKKRLAGPYYAVLFTDHIECYESYEEASLICRYHNPDVNMTINPESLHDKPKVAHRIPLTPGTEMSIERSSVSSTYNEHTINLKVKENRYRGIKKQDWQIAFEECNPMTGHPQVISTPAWQAQNLPPADTPGTSLSIAQKWFSVIDYCLEGPLCGTFGTTLWWSITRSTIPLPLVLHTCFRFVSQKGLQEEGILRVPGNNQDIIRLRRTFDACQTESTITDPNTAAGLFKLFFRENQDGLIPRNMYKAFTSNNCRAAGAGAAAEKRAPCVAVLRTLVPQLPVLNQICLGYLIHMLVKISQHAGVNKMFPKNCAMVLAPNVFRAAKSPHPQGLFTNAKDENVYASPQQMAEALAEQEAILLIMIEHFAEIFPRGSPYP